MFEYQQLGVFQVYQPCRLVLTSQDPTVTSSLDPTYTSHFYRRQRAGKPSRKPTRSFILHVCWEPHLPLVCFIRSLLDCKRSWTAGRVIVGTLHEVWTRVWHSKYDVFALEFRYTLNDFCRESTLPGVGSVPHDMWGQRRSHGLSLSRG